LAPAAFAREETRSGAFLSLGGLVSGQDECAVSARCADLHAFADGELPEAEVASFLEHFCSCARCQRELETIFALAALAQTMKSPPGPGDG
jgi:anti-sigma factor RsiW